MTVVVADVVVIVCIRVEEVERLDEQNESSGETK
jgi:hypothetical protein